MNILSWVGYSIFVSRLSSCQSFLIGKFEISFTHILCLFFPCLLLLVSVSNLMSLEVLGTGRDVIRLIITEVEMCVSDIFFQFSQKHTLLLSQPGFTRFDILLLFTC